MMNVISPGGPVQIANGAVFAPTGGRVIFVHDGFSGLSELPGGMHEYGRTTINAALSLCRTGRGDVIQLLPGANLTVAAADDWSNLAATGVTIKGPPTGPPATITWTVAGSTMLMDFADFCIDGGREDGDYGIILNLSPASGTVTVAAPITASAARCSIKRCQIRTAFDATHLATDCLTVATATDFLLKSNYIYGITGTPTTVLKTTGASSRLRILDNHIQTPIVTAATGVLIDISNAAFTGIQINGNLLDNSTSAAKYVLKPHATSRGEVSWNRVRVDDTATAATALGATTYTTLLGFHENALVDDDGLASVLMGTAST